MSDTLEIKGQVADILGERKVAVNRGSTNGVVKGADVRVLGAKTIKDPVTGDSLGAYAYVKASLEVTEVAERYCVASPITTYVFPEFAPILGYPAYGQSQTTSLETEPSGRPSMIVRVGDDVVIVVSISKPKAKS